MTNGEPDVSLKKSRVKNLLLPGLLVAVVLIVALALIPAEPGPRKATVAPDFSLDLLGGGAVKLSQYRGKVVVLEYFSSW